ncbi:MAG: tetratricopeptide repeat protein [Fidelibacterota bacterium]|nr:MAG: tetratricopeptide repeat protein [Candidatus Neomarinimicrobiota bacterium]
MTPESPSKLAAFIAELRHRRVFRVAVVYAGVAFIIIQLVDGIFDIMGTPPWIGQVVVVLLVLGFPIAVALAWAFDLTEEGLVRAKPKLEAAAKAPHHPRVGNKALAVIAALAIIVAAWVLLREPSPGGAAISSIAVLPLDDLMGDPEQEYFVEGMHEALISALYHISTLTVTSRTSAMRYKDADMLATDIAKELSVDAVVEGSVLLAGDQVRISVQLIDGKTDKHLWAEEYDRDLRDVLSLHSDVAQAIAGEIGLALTPEEETRLTSAPQVNPEAYTLYLKGWHFRNLQTEESIPKAVEYLEQAVALAPGSAQTWAALGISYYLMGGTGGIWSWEYAYNRMKQALDKALELDPNLPEAHAYLGLYQYSEQLDITGGEASIKRALELNPDLVLARCEYGWFLSRTGRPDDALTEFRRAQELDPLNPQPLLGVANVFYLTRQYDKAQEYYQAVLELSPDQFEARIWLVGIEYYILMQQGRYAEAADNAEKSYAEAAIEWLKAEALLGQLAAEWNLGNREKAYTVRDSLRFTGGKQENPYWAARLYAIMREMDIALDLLERAYEDTFSLGQIINLVYLPEFDSLRAEPRFKALLEKIGLTEVFDEYGQRIR